MKSKLLAGLILAGSTLFAGPRISVGFGFGVPVAPAYVEPAYIPPCPGPDFVFIDGYWQHRRPILEHRNVIVRHDAFRRDFGRR